MDSTIIIPIIFWNKSLPMFRISAISMSPNGKVLVTSSYSGQLCLWDLNFKQSEVTPKNLLIGHKYSVTCIVVTNEFVFSSCEGGLLCRWSLDDGYCEKIKRTSFVHRNMQLNRQLSTNNECLFTCGDYCGIFIIHSFTLQVIHVLNSQSGSFWISSFFVEPSSNHKADVVSGITYNGCLMKWIIDEYKLDKKNDICSNVLPVSNVISLKYNHHISKALVVSDYYWTICNIELSVIMYKVKAVNKERLLGGDFCDINIVVWSNAGKFYIYSIQDDNCNLISTLWDNFSKISVFEPGMNIFQTLENETYLIMGESYGKVNIWNVNSNNELSKSLFSFTIKDKWSTNTTAIFSRFKKYCDITCCIYVLELDKFFLGCFDGAILCVPAEKCLMSFCSNENQPSHEILLEHKGKINCLVYPNEKYSHFQKSHLVSGGSDFSVCLWDIFKLELLQKFSVQSGEILKLIVPPNNCNSRVKFSICSVSSDHSVALLNLKDRKCIILTSQHKFPVISVNWKPLDDFIVIECFDGTVYVWQIETGHLDRVLYGVKGQEVLFTCNLSNIFDTRMWDFYTNEDMIGKNSMRRQIFQIQDCFNWQENPFTLNGFLTNKRSECHIFMCNLENLITKVSSLLREQKEELSCDFSYKTYLLTQSFSIDIQSKAFTLLEKIKKETEIFLTQKNKIESVKENSTSQLQNVKNNDSFQINDTVLKSMQFFLSSIHLWGFDPSLDELLLKNFGLFKPETPLVAGIFSQPGVLSLFFPTSYNSSFRSSTLLASSCISIITLSNILQSSAYKLSNLINKEHITTKLCCEKLISLYESIFLNLNKNIEIPRPRIEVLAKIWQTRCLPLRKTVHKLLENYLQFLKQNENSNLLKFWYHYLPHFKILDKTSVEKMDNENLDLKIVSLILFGIVGSDLKFKANSPTDQENYIYQTCASFVYLILLPEEQQHYFYALRTMALDFIGRGYIVWEPFLKIDKILPILFQMCSDFPKSQVENKITSQYIDKSLTAFNALKAIAIARTSAFISYIKKEMGQVKSPQTNKKTFLVEDSKAAILSVLIFLLEKTPYIMVLYLNDVISIFVYCIDCSHLKQENLGNLVPMTKKFRQLHHSVISQKIAVGLSTGDIVLHDLKTGKSHSIAAHKDLVSAVKFSEDGKYLVSYSCYESRITFWQIFSGIFGLGHMHLKCIKSFETFQINDEEIKNHFEVAELTWNNSNSVTLSLCDGTKTVFHF